MKTLIATLRLSDSTSEQTRERCPDVVFTLGGSDVAAVRTDTERPKLPFADGEIGSIEIRDDAMSRVIDEAAWLAEMSRVLIPNGTFQLTVPADGPLAWLDTMNIYRYIADISKRGDAPDASQPTGWNRHYQREGVILLLADAGFDSIQLQSTNYSDREIGMLATLFWKNWVRGERSAERTAFPRFGARRTGERRFPLRTTWSVSTRSKS